MSTNCISFFSAMQKQRMDDAQEFSIKTIKMHNVQMANQTRPTLIITIIITKYKCSRFYKWALEQLRLSMENRLNEWIKELNRLGQYDEFKWILQSKAVQCSVFSVQRSCFVFMCKNHKQFVFVHSATQFSMK